LTATLVAKEESCLPPLAKLHSAGRNRVATVRRPAAVCHYIQ